MTIELRRRSEHFSRVDVYGVTGMPRAKHSDYYEIEPATVVVEVFREEDRSPWILDGVSLKGPRILKDETVGVREESHYYMGKRFVDHPHAPAWLVSLADKAYRVAEADRLGATPLCPTCETPSILADPTDPEEEGEYCESCGLHFDAGNGLRRIPSLYRPVANTSMC